MATDLFTVMTALGDALETIDGLNVFPFPPESASPPFAFVNMPESIQYDYTYGDACAQQVLEVHVGCASADDASYVLEQCAYASPDGPMSVKEALEAAAISGAVHVTQATFGQMVLGSGTYAAVVFSVTVTA